MNPKDILFIVCCVLAILIVIVYSILSSILFKKEQAIKNPYYFCDGTWECCNSPDCDKNIGKGLFSKAVDSYKPSDNWKPGSNYHQNCVLPAQNAILNYDANANHVFNLQYIYDGGSTGLNNPSVYYKGCTGPGGTGDCANPALNPQYAISELSCPYVSFDSVPPGGTGGIYTNPSKTLLNGTNGYNFGATLNQPGWAGNSATSYIAGYNGSQPPKNTYFFPYNSKNGESVKNQYTGGAGGAFTGGNSHNNVLHYTPGKPNTFPNGAAKYTGGGSFA